MKEWMHKAALPPQLPMVLHPPYFEASIILNFKWSVVSYLQCPLNSHLAPQINGPGDRILNKL